MEGSKNAMYAQAGRSRGWVQGETNNYAMPRTPSVPEMLVNPTMPFIPAMPAEQVMPMASPIPEPPVVVAPEAVNSDENGQSIAMAYVTPQKWQELYENEQGFNRGTLFAELDLPFVGEGACSHE